jgi:HK97 gp10 family phage protein
MPVAYADLTKLVERLDASQKKEPQMTQHVLVESGEWIANRMRELVPVRTGRLQGSIQAVEYTGKVVVGPVDVPYALYVEYGTSRMRAQPYIRPAAKEYIDRVNRILGERAIKLIETGSPT